MASSSIQAGELERMMLIVEQMMRSRDNDASMEKAIDRVVELEGQFDGRNVTKFLDTYRREMNQRDVSEARQITTFKRVVAYSVQRRVIELQEGKTTWSVFERTILAEFAIEDSTRMSRHALMKCVEIQAQHRPDRPDRLKKPRTGSVGTDRLGRGPSRLGPIGYAGSVQRTG